MISDKHKLVLKIFLQMKAKEIGTFIFGALVLIFSCVVLVTYFWLPVYIYEWLGNPFLEKPVEELPGKLQFIFIVYWWVSLFTFPFLLHWLYKNWVKANRLAQDRLRNERKSRPLTTKEKAELHRKTKRRKKK